MKLTAYHIFILRLIIFHNYIYNVLSFDFDKERISVRFSPYCKHSENGEQITDISKYTIDEVQTMVNLVGTKFSTLVTTHAGADIEFYVPNITYNNRSHAIAYVGEMAAKINRHHKNKALTVLVGIRPGTKSTIYHTEVFLALEIAKKANNIYPETVKGILLERANKETDAERILKYIAMVRGTATQLGIRLGASVHCEHFLPPVDNNKFYQIQIEIVEQVDFIVCDIYPPTTVAILGPEVCFDFIGEYFLTLKTALLLANKNVEVIDRTGWTSSGDQTYETVENQRIYWESVSKWSTKNNITMILYEAFDSPVMIDKSNRHYGWWKLTENSKANLLSGYIEKSTGKILASEAEVSILRENISNISTDIGIIKIITMPSDSGITTKIPIMSATDRETDITQIESATIGNTDPSTTHGFDGTKLGESSVKKHISKTQDGDTSTKNSTPITTDNRVLSMGQQDGNIKWSSSLSIQEQVGIGLGSIATIAIVTFIIVVAFRCTRAKQQEEFISTKKWSEFLFGSKAPKKSTVVDIALKHAYDTSYEILKEDIDMENANLLGTGQFACVLEVRIKDKEEYIAAALKMAKADAPRSTIDGLLSEIKILIYLGRHPNIVGMIGAYTAELQSGILYVFTELCSLGSLEAYLRELQTSRGSKECYTNGIVETVWCTNIYHDMIRWSLEIARGMEYLGTKHIVHADLATRNILLTAERTAKITDFGLSRKMYNYKNYVKTKQEPFPWRWMTIESLKRCEFSAQSDVWSYGITLWEIFSLGDTPYPGMRWTIDLVELLVNGLRLKCPILASEEIFSVMSDCWYKNPEDRPTFTILLERIKVILQTFPQAR